MSAAVDWMVRWPDAALAVLTLGLLLIYLELNRPGWLVPGALGLLGVLLALDALGHHPLRPAAFALLLPAAALLSLEWLRPVPWAASAAATLGLMAGLTGLLAPPARLHGEAAVVCGGVLGLSTWLLARIARRARQHKAVN